MKLILQYFLSGLIGFIVAYSVMNFSEISFSAELTVIGLLAIIIVLAMLSAFRIRQIKSLNAQHFTGDEEDEVDERKYRLFTDYLLYANVSFVLSILAFCLSIVTAQPSVNTLIAFAPLIVSTFLIQYMQRLMRQVYPERNFPSPSDPNYAKSVLDIADDGEKSVILNGLYKSYNLLNVSLIFAIMLATVYSVNSDNTQTFSIVMMAIVMLLVNGRYALAIRNK